MCGRVCRSDRWWRLHLIRGVADARVTIVSMDGRSQQQMVNGDTRNNVLASVYGVILEQGKAVIREKIVVRWFIPY